MAYAKLVCNKNFFPYVSAVHMFSILASLCFLFHFLGVLISQCYRCLQNVLHWHIVDTQSFPLEIPSYPKLWDGAYSISERYTTADAAEIVRQVLYVLFLNVLPFLE